ncbi:MAG: serine hydrolase domain-containing protein [Candidatus Kariarchaeaceae archaeon]
MQSLTNSVHGNSNYQTRSYWPTAEWQKSPPENQGMDSSKLDEMEDYIIDSGFNIDGILIVRHGYIVFESNPTGYSLDEYHMIQSCTKSVTSALIGIAIKEGFIESINQKLVDFFPDREIANLDARKKNITLFHLLTMSDGLYWTELDYSYNDPRNTLGQMWYAPDPIQHILDQPMAREPGQSYKYNSGATMLLGEIIKQATGMNAHKLAKEYLFSKIGIEQVLWGALKNDVLHTDGGLVMKIRDMARLGYLFLNNGTWNGEQILHSDWIQQSSSSHYQTRHGFWNGTSINLHGYGYLWWIFSGTGAYAATGHYEQKIIVVPSHDLVTVITANIADEVLYEVPYLTDKLLFEYIIPSISSEYNTEKAGSSLWFLDLTSPLIILLVNKIGKRKFTKEHYECVQ